MYSTQPVFQKTWNHPQFSQKSAVAPLPPSPIYDPPENNLNWAWYSPPANSVPAQFCIDTSLHGLKYLGQRGRHIFERIFWLAAFLASTITSIYLIWGVWQDYANTPIITVFKPTETTIDLVPFPAVTICNVNGIQGSTFQKIQEYVRIK